MEVGTLLLAVDSLPRLANLNVPGAPAMDVIFSSAGFKDLLAGALAALKIKPGSLDYLKLTSLYGWVLDRADPGNFGAYLQRKQLPDLVATEAIGTPQLVAKKQVIVQLGDKDDIIPIVYGRYLASAIGIDPTVLRDKLTYSGQGHSFLLRALAGRQRYQGGPGADGELLWRPRPGCVPRT